MVSAVKAGLHSGQGTTAQRDSLPSVAPGTTFYNTEIERWQITLLGGVFPTRIWKTIGIDEKNIVTMSTTPADVIQANVGSINIPGVPNGTYNLNFTAATDALMPQGAFLIMLQTEAAATHPITITSDVGIEINNISGFGAQINDPGEAIIVYKIDTNNYNAVFIKNFNSLAPSVLKGDLIVHDGTINTRLAVGANGTVPIADSAEAKGIAWNPYPLVGPTANVSRALTIADVNKRLISDGGAPVALTLPVGLTANVNDFIFLHQKGAGWLAVQAAVGVTLNNVNGSFHRLPAQHSAAVLVQTAVDVWEMSDLYNVPSTTKGDLNVRGVDVMERLPVGTDGQIIYADATAATGLSYSPNLDMNINSELIRFQRAVVSATYAPNSTIRVIANGAIQAGAPVTASNVVDFRVTQIAAGDPDDTPVIGIAVTAAAGAGSELEICNASLATVQMDSVDSCSVGDPIEKSDTDSGRVQSTPISVGTFSVAAQAAASNDNFKVWLKQNEQQ